MKKLCLLSGLMLLGIASINADIIIPGGLKEKHISKIEDVQHEKIKHQKELARPAVYKMLDPLVEKKDWPAIFAILDQMQRVIDVNEYRTSWGSSLLAVAALSKNFLAVKTLLEKYNADSNVQASSGISKGNTALMFACSNRDLVIVKLLLQYGANPYLKNAYGTDSFKFAEKYPEVIKLLQEYTGSARVV
jgi:hypothetical protein